MSNEPSPSPPVHSLAQAHPQITAALSISPMQQEQFVSPPMMPMMGQQGQPGGGPVRNSPHPQQVRPMPYNMAPGQMRHGHPPPQGTPHYSPINQNQFAVPQQQINMGPRPQMPPNPQGGPPQMHVQNMQGPSPHPMAMGGPPQHMVQQPSTSMQNQFGANISPMPPQQMGHPPQAQSMPHMTPQAPQQATNLQLNNVPIGSVMEKVKLDDMMAQISKTTFLEESVKDALVEYADEFVQSIIDKACRMIRGREVKKIEARDIEFILKNVYHMPVVPRAATHIFGAPEAIDVTREKNIPTEAHKQRVAYLKKQLKRI